MIDQTTPIRAALKSLPGIPGNMASRADRTENALQRTGALLALMQACNPEAMAALIDRLDALEAELREHVQANAFLELAGRDMRKLIIDAACFSYWVREAAARPAQMAKLIAACTTEDEYRAAIIPCVLQGNQSGAGE